MVLVTLAMSFFSYRSTVWKTSISGTPYSLRAFWKLLMFSMNLNWPPDELTLGTELGARVLISLHSTWPSLSTSSYAWPAGNFSPMMASIHSWASLSISGLRLPAICTKISKQTKTSLVSHLQHFSRLHFHLNFTYLSIFQHFSLAFSIHLGTNSTFKRHFVYDLLLRIV